MAEKDENSKRSQGRWFVFIYAIVILAVLVLVALLYAAKDLRFPSSVPRAILFSSWAGALGGIAISFKGVYDNRAVADPVNDPHNERLWDNQLIVWHIGRPFSGVIVGIAVFLLLKAAVPTGQPSGVVISAVAFVLGTQDKGFFNFVRQIGNVIVSVPAPKAPAAPPPPPPPPPAEPTGM